MSAPAEVDPLGLLASLVLESGELWGAVATPWQRADAAAMLRTAPTDPRLTFATRPRGSSKTTDAAAVALTALLCQAPPASVSHAYARDLDQARLLLTALVGLAHRSGLAPLLAITGSTVTVRATAASLQIESADAASAFGHIPYLVVCDELCQWPTTRAAQALWEAVVSGLPKRPDSRLLVITTAGDPVHWSRRVLTAALASPATWHVSEVPGPSPWASPADLAEQRRLLSVSAYARLHLNIWSASEDRLVSTEDLAACSALAPSSPHLAAAAAEGGWPYPHDVTRAHRYAVGVDLGLKADRTVIATCHYESDTTRVVLDRLDVLSGSPSAPVKISRIERLVRQVSTSYGRPPVRVDPWQAVGSIERLALLGVRAEPWPFTTTSVGRLASTLHLLLREHRLVLPAEGEGPTGTEARDLLDELATVRLRETSTPGVVRLDHDSGQHDDRAVAVGLACLALVERPDTGPGRITVPRALVGHRAVNYATPAAPRTAGLRHLARRSPRLPGGALLVPGSGNDPRRVSRDR